MRNDSNKLRRYLLGDLTDDELGEVDLWIIDDEESGEPMSVAEDDLIEDYLERALSAEDEALFRSNFLVSNERRSQVEEMVMLKRFAASAELSPAVVVADQPASSSFFQRLFAFSRPMTAVSAVLLIGSLSFIGWRLFLSPSATPLEMEYAALNSNDLATADALFSTVQLSSGTLRDTAPASKIKADGMSESVLFRLALPFNPSTDFRPRAEVIQKGDKVYTAEGGRIYAAGAGSEVRLLLPRSILVKGQNQIRLTDRGNADTALLYSLSVE